MPTPPKPTPSQIRKYLAKFEKLENYRLQEKSLNLLFQKLCPENKKIEDILLKVSSLNDFYSTNIFDTFSVAKHILNNKIDRRLKAGDCDLVNEIATVQLKGKIKNFYSFASKYCNHHDPKKYPIFDSYVLRMLLHYRSVGGFPSFKKDEVKTYKRFIEIIAIFQRCYRLEEFSLRQIDIFLWMAGKECFPRKY